MKAQLQRKPQNRCIYERLGFSHWRSFTNFPISQQLISSVKNARSKYVADQEMQMEFGSKQEQGMKKKEQDV